MARKEKRDVFKTQINDCKEPVDPKREKQYSSSDQKQTQTEMELE